jgi:beta-glucosidase
MIPSKMRTRNCKNGIALVFASLMSVSGLAGYAQQKAKSVDPITKKVDALLAKMTIDEKVGQLNQYTGDRLATGPLTPNGNKFQEIKQGLVGSMLNVQGVKDTRMVQELAMQSRLKIPLLFSLDVIHGYQTIFPVPLGEAASWDMDAIRLSAHVAAKEAAASGIHWTFAPMVDIARDARWGRMMEGAGEDTYLGSKIARARVLGFQGDKLGGTDAVMACAKHFAAYGAAIAGRDYNAVDMSDNQLWETYLPPFKAAADAGAATFMNSFNSLNGIPATGNSYLQRDILKGKWGYKGFVVSDWGSIGEMIPHGFAADKYDAAFKAITAGSDMDMESKAYHDELAAIVKKNPAMIKLVDDAVRRVLYKKFELGLFDDPYKFSNEAREQQVMHDPANLTAEREVAKKSIVLLKNQNELLPLQTDVKKIAIIGPLGKSKRDLLGGWTVSTDTVPVVSLFDGVKNAIGANAKLTYAKGCEITGDDHAAFTQAVETAKDADVVILALGESWTMSGEAKSKTDISLPGVQEQLFEAVRSTGKPVVVVLMAGRPMIFNHIADNAPAILYTWFTGTEGGNAIADVLFGKYNPGGKLPVTFPRNMGQLPLYYAQTSTGRPVTNPNNVVYKSAYIDAPNTPKYAFGYGLSYTTFKYSDLKLSKTSFKATEQTTANVTITNSGKYAGEEVVQLYLRDMVGSVVRPVKELKDFQKIMLQPGESKVLTFNIGKDQLAFYDQHLNWIVEPGAFKLMIGSASDDIRLESKFAVVK